MAFNSRTMASNPVPYGGTRTPVAGLRTVPEPEMPDFSPRRAAGPTIAYNPGTREMFVNGRTFGIDDEQAAVESAQQGGGYEGPGPEGAGWQAVDPESFVGFVSQITNPTMGRLASRNFGIGVDNMQLLAGRGLQFLGAESAGEAVVAQQLEDIRKKEPYQRQFTDIGSSSERGVIDWFVANLAQQGPNLVESAVTAALGFAAGGLAGGGANPVTAAGGALAGLAGKSAFKAAIMAAAKKHAAGELLDAAEAKLLREAAGITGAALASVGSNYATGVADVYGETIESGSPSRGTAALMGVPYAALESVPEFLLAGRFFGDMMQGPARQAGATFRQKATDLLKQSGKGFTAGAALEGGTEAGQEALLLAANPDVDWNSPEGLSRLVNSFAAGAAIGGPIGGVVNLTNRAKPSNLLNPSQSADPTAVKLTDGAPQPMAEGYGGWKPQVNADIVTTEPGGAASRGNLPIGNTLRPKSMMPEVPPIEQAVDSPYAPSATPMVAGEAQINPLRRGAAQTTAVSAPDPQAAVVPAAAEPAAPSPVPTKKSLRQPPATPQPAPVVSNVPTPAPVAPAAAPVAQAPAAPVQEDRETAMAKAVTAALKKTFAKRPTVVEPTPEPQVLEEREPPLAENHRRFYIIDRKIVDKLPRGQIGFGVRYADYEIGSKMPLPQEIVRGARTLKPVRPSDKLKAKKEATAEPASPFVETPSSAPSAPDAETNVAAEPENLPKVGDEDSELDTAIEEINKNMTDEFGLASVIEQAYFDYGDTNPKDKARRDRARKFLDTLDRTNPVHLRALRIAIGDDFEPFIGSGQSTGKMRDITNEILRTPGGFRMLARLVKDNPRQRGWLEDLLRNDPEGFAIAQAEMQDTGMLPQDAVDIVQFIRDFNNAGRTQALSPMEQSKLLKMVTTARKSGSLKMSYEGALLETYFPNGKPRVIRQKDDTLRIAAEGKGVYSLADWNSIEGALDLNDKPVAPMPVGKVQLMVRGFLENLRIKPKLSVFANQADLKKKDPELYARAVASRPQGDFDAAKAAAFSFGANEVIVFSDRIMGDAHLRFVLAHETIGHIGFRAMVPRSEFNGLLDGLYTDGTQALKASVDAAMAARGMSKREAVEEYMADMAGTLETHLVARILNALKSFMNKFGFRFEDDTVRYWLDQSRRYVRYGGRPLVMSEFAQRFQQIEGMEDPDGTGRFSRTDYGVMTRILARDVYNPEHNIWGDSDWVTMLRERSRDISNHVDKFVSNLRLTNYQARENFGMREVYTILSDMTETARKYVNKYNRSMATALNRAVELGPLKFGGATDENTRKVNMLLLDTTEAKFDRPGAREITALPNIITFREGLPVVNWEAVEQLKAMGRMTLEEAQQGMEYDVLDAQVMTDEQRTKLESERDAAMAKAQDEVAADKIRREYDARLAQVTTTQRRTNKTQAFPELTADSIEWKMYNEVLDTMAMAQVDKVLSQFQKVNGQWDHVFGRIAKSIGRDLTDADRNFIAFIRDKYISLLREGATLSPTGMLDTLPESRDNAAKFLEQVNELVLARTLGKADAGGRLLIDVVTGYFSEAEQQSVRKAVEDYRKNNDITGSASTTENRFVLQHEIANLTMMEQSKATEERQAMMNIATGYIPLTRRGDWAMTIVATDADGKTLKLHPDFMRSLARMHFESQSMAEAEASRLAAEFAGKDGKDTYRMAVLKDGHYVPMDVKLTPQVFAVQQEKTDPGRANVHDMMRFITQYGINLTPQKREEILTAMTGANDRARKRFKREGVEGADINMIRAASEHLEMTASIVARNSNMHRLDEVMDPSGYNFSKLWRGDAARYEELKADYERSLKDASMDPAEKQRIKREFDDYHFVFVTKNAKQRGNLYLDKATQLIAFVEGQRDVGFSDFAQAGLAGTIRNWTVIPQLGGSIATGVLNLISLPVNLLPMLATYNSNRAFGGGFGFGNSAAAMASATNAVGYPWMNTVEYYQSLLEDPAKREARGLSEAEVKYLIAFIDSGRGDAAAMNSMLSTTRGRSPTGAQQKAIEYFMMPFAVTEQMSRRVGGLTAFRLHYNRSKAEGKNDEQAFEEAVRFSEQAVDNAIGQYANFGMPPAFRGGVAQFLFMYKVFPVTTAMMLRNLSPSGKIALVGALILLGGMKGIPFADDLLDLIDFIAQRVLGLKLGSAEAQFYKAADNIFPGSGRWLSQGVVDQFLPFTVSNRTQVGDIIPGTGMLLPNPDMYRELVEVLGPAASALFQYAWTARNLTAGAVDGLDGNFEGTSLSQILRESPVTFFRGIGDSIAYAQNGAIVNKQGYVVSEDLNWATYLSRLAGFQPSSATEQYEATRMAKRIDGYNKEVSASFRRQWISARVANDQAGMQRIEADVRYWNEHAEGTGLEIRNFRKNANRAFKESRKTVEQRALGALSKSAQKEAEFLFNLYN